MKMNKNISLFILALLLPIFVQAQQILSCTAFNSVTRETLPFATIKYGATGKGTIADLDGRFELEKAEMTGITWIEISSLGYEPKKLTLPLTVNKVYLTPLNKDLAEVVITPPYEKMRRIIDLAIANKPVNNPDKLDWYQCHVYYKMVVDALLPEYSATDTTKDAREFRDFSDNQHVLMSETYSKRTWEKPQKLQEDVIGSRFSGFQKSMFTGLVTDVLPFHAYNNYISLNGKEYHNPISKGYELYYQFNLNSELVQGMDTVWVLSFVPNGKNANELKGTVYINSNGYAISDLIARSSDTILKREVRIEQEYQLVNDGGEQHWFPAHLNYIIDWTIKSSSMTLTYHLKGNSLIDSVSFRKAGHFNFDKTHTVKLAKNADELPDSVWKKMRPEALDKKEARTYVMIDSLGEAVHLDKIMSHLSRLPEGKVAIGPVDMDITRLFSSNYYEGTRLGMGLQTNEKLIKWLSVGGWAGYGFNDVHWKYGVFAEAYADKEREFVIKAGYTDDINDPGRVRMSRDLDKNYLNSYLLRRVDHVKTYSAGIRKKLGYWSLELTARQEEIKPLYTYALSYDGVDYTSFTANEASLNIRYAFAERSAPFFGHYYSTGSKYPIFYGKITTGNLLSGTLNIPYTQALAAVTWTKHINRIGNERILIKGGKLWSDSPLPLSKLFAGNGYRYDPKSGSGASVYVFGGMMTMLPYGYYTDQFVSVVLKHDFDWKLYKLKIPQSPLSSAPSISLQYGMLYGTLEHPEAQKYVAFAVPDNAYHEGGLILNNLIRLNYLNVYYITLNVGYFYHIEPTTDASKNGKVVIGFGIEF